MKTPVGLETFVLIFQANVGTAWICALATLILVPSDVYHAMQVCTL